MTTPMRRTSGFTLIELLIVVVLTGIIAAFAIPSFNRLIASNNVTSSTNKFVGALNYARSEAVNRGRLVQVQPVDNGGSDNEWGNGLRVWIDDNGNSSFDSGEAVRVINEFSGVTIDGPDSTTNFGFEANGFSDPAPTSVNDEYSLTVCGESSDVDGREIRIGFSGRMRVIDQNVSCN